MKVKLNPSEITLCETFAKKVSEAKNGTYGPTFLQNFTLGIKGEMVYAKIFNLNTNFCIYEGKQGDGGTDFDGVNVKTVSKSKNKTSDPWLKVSIKQHNRHRGKVKKYALVVELNDNEFEYMGSIDYYDFEKKKQTVDFGTEKAYYVKVKDLTRSLSNIVLS
jgi:hypothetical protein